MHTSENSISISDNNIDNPEFEQVFIKEEDKTNISQVKTENAEMQVEEEVEEEVEAEEEELPKLDGAPVQASKMKVSNKAAGRKLDRQSAFLSKLYN